MLKDFFHRWAEKKAEHKRRKILRRPVDVRELSWRRFKVTDQEVADRLRVWIMQNEESLPEIEQFLRSMDGAFFGTGYSRPRFALDDNGRLVMGAKDEDYLQSTWYLREADTVIRNMLEGLPAASSFADLRDAISWPTINPDDYEGDRQPFIESINRLPYPQCDEFGVYVYVPVCDYFAIDPHIYKILEQWQPPKFLQELLPHVQNDLNFKPKP